VQRLVAATRSSVLPTDCKHEGACSERVNWANAFSLCISNWLLTEKHCACAFFSFSLCGRPVANAPGCTAA
jgi:hypothetical protein